ncbi:NADH dehydrogenase [ubiquinone] 1 alpha subcomplex subunit 9 [Skeletonema marinoi]|uniref:NADH dehydrogenase [ubiquinone] 1 alpha subcomplex subunit 9 n=1 Tax=Skeletonema marinoi TaxID=267567 RepID=A0AAD8XV12_9STRA|nr:NADH dehydrogenase [ubiquinone] 1 alpha subcomplex subunit 9 [Skeletonema marinoi]
MALRTAALKPLRKSLLLTRAFSTELPRITERRPNETGHGGRASDAGVKVALFGATGFLGRYVSSGLGSNGTLTYIGTRGDEFAYRHLRPHHELGRAKFSYYSSRDKQSMADIIADADIVINLIGKYYDTKALENTDSFPFLNYKVSTSVWEANVEVPKMIAELCTEMQVDNLIHVSSAAAGNVDSASEWARSKAEGEKEVLKAYPWATIVRPTQMFGHEDKLLNLFAKMAERFPVIPLVDGGHALTQPVYVDDVARTINRIVDDPEMFEGRRVDCFGPQDYSYAELAKFVYDITEQEPTLSDVPAEVVKYGANVLQYEGNPMLTPDMVDLWTEDYLPEMTAEKYAAQKQLGKVFTMKDLGVEATPIEKMAFKYLYRFRKGGHFILAEGYH